MHFSPDADDAGDDVEASDGGDNVRTDKGPWEVWAAQQSLD